jgi:serine/threonine-protein kinase
MDLEQEAARRVGTTLRNKWTLDRLIGTGGMAAVYEATQAVGRREAIKVLHADVARDPEVRARFEQEAQAVNHFKHPGTVEVREVDVAEDGAPFMVMELLDGRPLSEIARGPGGVPEGELLRLVDELLDVLAAAHAQGIIHRDVKPDNLFVLRDGHLKVLDFGIARVRAGVPLELHTRGGGPALGTAGYMPPEQIKGEEIDARADVFAVGATMFRLLAKRRVHEADAESQVLLKVASEPAPPLAAVAPGVSRDVCRVVDRALMFDRAQRYPDARTMQADVRAILEGRPPPYAAARDEPPPTTVPERSPGTVVVSVGAPDGADQPAITGSEPTAAMAAFPDMAAAPPASGSTLPAMISSSSSLPAVLAPAPPSGSTLPATLGPSAAAPAPVAPTLSDGGAEPAERTMRPGGAAATISSAISAPEPTTKPMTNIPVPDSVEAPPPPAPPALAPLSERTLRSQGVVAPVKPAGYSVPAVIPLARPPGAAHGPPTQPAGVAPLAPGESIPVVAPTRRAREPGEMRLWPLVLVGVVFAAIGIGVTLWLTIGSHLVETGPPVASAEPSSEPPADTGSRWPLRAPPRSTAPPHTTAVPPKQHPKPTHGK